MQPKQKSLTRCADNKGCLLRRFAGKLCQLADREKNYIPFATCLLGVIPAACREFSDRVKIVSGNTRKPNRVRDINHDHLGKITKAEIVAQCPDISRTTIRRALNDLVKSGEVIKIGGRYTSYTWNREID